MYNFRSPQLRRAVQGAGLAVLLMLAACGGPGTASPPTLSDSSASSSASSVTTTSQPTAPSSLLPPPATVDPTSASGGDAGPTTSQQRDFQAWYGYEVLLASDANRQFDELYQSGTYACAKLLADTSSLQAEKFLLVLAELKQGLGYQGTTAEAILKAAVNTICPSQNLGNGYQTYFDKNVSLFMTTVAPKVTFNGTPPPYYAYGFFAKGICDDIETRQPSDLVRYVYQGEGRSLYLTQVAGTNQQVLKIFVQEGTLAQCPSYFDNLPGYWTTA